MDSNVSLLIMLFCLLSSAFFSSTETAYSSLNIIKIKNLAKNGNKRAKLVEKIEDKYDKMLTTILIGNNLVNILGTSICTIFFVQLFGNAKGPTLSTIVATIVILAFGEITPKVIAKEIPETFALFVAPFLRFLMVLFAPFSFLFGGLKVILSKFFIKKEDKGITGEELITMVEVAKEDGNIDETEKELIRNAIKFDDLEVGDIYTPRIDMVSISIDTPVDEIEQLYMETAYSRLPVYNQEKNNILGILNYKDFYTLVKKQNISIKEVLQDTIFTIRQEKIDEVLKKFQSTKTHMGTVVNEFGEIIGIITMEDILEELVGEIWDECDEIENDVETINETEFIVSGRMNLEDFLKHFDIKKEENSHTVSGWVMDKLKRIPNDKDEFQYENLLVNVMRVENKRVEKVKIKYLENIVESN